jgi:hypothetical protein
VGAIDVGDISGSSTRLNKANVLAFPNANRISIIGGGLPPRLGNLKADDLLRAGLFIDSRWQGFQSPGMPLYLLRYRGVDHSVVGLAIVSALDEILARRTAEAANLHWPGAVCTVDELDPASVPAALIGRRFSLEELAVKKPPARSAPPHRTAVALPRTG